MSSARVMSGSAFHSHMISMRQSLCMKRRLFGRREFSLAICQLSKPNIHNLVNRRRLVLKNSKDSVTPFSVICLLKLAVEQFNFLDNLFKLRTIFKSYCKQN